MNRTGHTNLAELALADRHAHGRRDGGGGVPGTEAVELGLRALREAGQAAALPQRVHPISPPREDLVRVHLFSSEEQHANRNTTRQAEEDGKDSGKILL